MARALDPILDAALTALGATPEEKQTLVGYVVAAAESNRNQVLAMRAQAQQSFNAADALEPQAVAFETMLEKLTNIVDE
jgi:hypothetical protein